MTEHTTIVVAELAAKAHARLSGSTGENTFSQQRARAALAKIQKIQQFRSAVVSDDTLLQLTHAIRRVLETPDITAAVSYFDADRWDQWIDKLATADASLSGDLTS